MYGICYIPFRCIWEIDLLDRTTYDFLTLLEFYPVTHNPGTHDTWDEIPRCLLQPSLGSSSICSPDTCCALFFHMVPVLLLRNGWNFWDSVAYRHHMHGQLEARLGVLLAVNKKSTKILHPEYYLLVSLRVAISLYTIDYRRKV